MRFRSALIGLLAVCVLGLLAVSVASLQSNTKRPIQIYEPNYAPDGRGIYYRQEYDLGDRVAVEAHYRASIHARRQRVDDFDPGIRRSYNAADEHLLSKSPSGKLQLDCFGETKDIYPASFADTDGLVVVDTETGNRSLLRRWPDALWFYDAVWLDEETVLAAVDWEGAAVVELIDINTGRVEPVYRDTSEDSFDRVVGRIVVAPSGVVLFNVGDKLFRYHAESHRTVELGSTARGTAWDYSPSRSTLVEVDAENPNRLIERPLPCE